ncbi:MAG: N-acetyl-gamma-glutamyl-phosphate reductase [Saccharofermentanales bacterium]|jgi:N-acetyl-gamma-glutamyl-phosphate reductase
MNKGFRVGIIGATGYVGVELVRLLSSHPFFKLTRLVSQSYAGKPFSEIYPAFNRVVDTMLSGLDIDQAVSDCDLVITALPHGVSASVVPKFLERGVRVLDHSGDFRYRRAAVYEQAYRLRHPCPDLLGEAVYGLPEIYRNEIAKSRLVANPGCYPTCALLALKPLLQAGVINTEGIVVDAVSGVSGAGRKSDLAYSFCEQDASFKAYGVIGHRHTSEIEQEAGFLAGLSQPPLVTFTPHLAPMKRGMLATVYADLLPGTDASKLQDLFAQTYENEPFIRLLSGGQLPETRSVLGTNYADISVFSDDRTNKVKIISVLDNLGKGAAGQAVQALNLMAGLKETSGLEIPGFAI